MFIVHLQQINFET